MVVMAREPIAMPLKARAFSRQAGIGRALTCRRNRVSFVFVG
jgi:hypothetical protein